jgi:anti-sigma-K factor RskA
VTDVAAAVAAIQSAQGALNTALAALTPTPPTVPPVGNYKGFVNTGQPTDLAKARDEMGGTQVRADYWRVDDAYVSAANAAGVKVLLMAGYALGLSTRGDHYPPDAASVGLWCDKVVTKAQRYANSLLGVECWNEPWLLEFWQSGQSPAAYMVLVRALAAKLWAVLPSMPLVVSLDYYMQGGASQGLVWQDALLKSDTTGLLADPRIRPTTHNYCGAGAPTDPRSAFGWAFQRYLRAYDALRAHGHPNPQVWVGEYGWRAGSGTGGTDVDLATQASYTTQAIRLMQASGKVERAFVFEYKPGDTYNYNIVGKPAAAAIKALA